MTALEATEAVIDGFQSPLGLELLATVDEARQLLTLVVPTLADAPLELREKLAFTPDERNAPAFSLDACPRLPVIGTRDEIFLSGAHLEGERALARFREHDLGVETDADLST